MDFECPDSNAVIGKIKVVFMIIGIMGYSILEALLELEDFHGDV